MIKITDLKPGDIVMVMDEGTEREDVSLHHGAESLRRVKVDGDGCDHVQVGKGYIVIWIVVRQEACKPTAQQG